MTDETGWTRNADGTWTGPAVEVCPCGALIEWEVCDCSMFAASASTAPTLLIGTATYGGTR